MISSGLNKHCTGLFPLILVIAALLLNGCGKGPAPLDNKTFDKIGQEMLKNMYKNGMNPSLSKEKTIQIYRETFDACGYSYSKTLNSIADKGFNVYSEGAFVSFLVPYINELPEAKSYLTNDEYKSAVKISDMFNKLQNN